MDHRLRAFRTPLILLSILLLLGESVASTRLTSPVLAADTITGVYFESILAGRTTVYTAPLERGGSSQAVATLGAAITPLLGVAAITGLVYRDFNSDGLITANSVVTDTGVSGVTVTAYDPTDAAVGLATTDATGAYTLTLTNAGPYRVEFSGLPTGYEPTYHGAQNGTSTQFVTTLAGANNVNLGINIPVDYSQDNPRLVTNMYVNGDPNNAAAPTAAIVSFPYTAAGTLPVAAQTTLATKKQVGTTFGLGYDRSTKILYAAAFLKRHAGLGPNGLGAIYAIPTTGGTPTLFTNLATLGADIGSVPSNAARGLGAPSLRNSDTVTTNTDQVGAKGLGGIAISDDDSTLYVTSLKDQKLYALNVPGGTLAGSYVIPSPCDPTTGLPHPFGLKYHDGNLYVGGVCDAEISQNASDLRAYVYRFDGVTFTLIFTMTLNYGRGTTTTGCGLPANWLPWKSGLLACGGPVAAPFVQDPQPILSDITFDVDGSMVLGFMDRSGHETALSGFEGAVEMSGLVAGDTVRVCNVLGSLIAEGSAGCAYNYTGLAGDEFYWDSRPDTFFREIMVGGVAILPGSGEVVSTATDPASSDSLGVMHSNNTTGAANIRYNTYFGDRQVSFAKGDGIGDVELLANAAPLELGNRVWNDLNGNGVQDPGEPGINGVTVSLQGPSGTVTMVTSGDGNYYFGNLQATSAYTLTITPVNEAALNGLNLTTANAQVLSGSTTSNHALNDTRDSDAMLISGDAMIVYATGTAGQNNHSLDFGFVPPIASLGDYVWLDANKNGVQDAGESGINGVTVNLYDSTGTKLIATTTTVNNGVNDGYYHFAGLIPNTTYVVKLDNPADYAAGGPLANFTLTAVDQGGNDAKDSDATVVSGFPTIVTAPTGADKSDTPTYDIGFYQPLSLGNLVWNDLNNNGLKDTSENGIDGVKVNLYVDTNGDGVLGAGDTLVDTQMTSNGGHYLFTDLGQATYLVQLDATNFAAGGPLIRFISSTGTNGPATGPYEPGATGPADNDDNGSGFNGGIVSGPIALAAGLQPTSEPDTTMPTGLTDPATDANSNLTIDFGVFQLPSVTAITLAQFGATWQGATVVVQWATSSEIDSFGFHLYRSSDGRRASATRITPTLIMATGRGQAGATYTWTDTGVTAGQTYTYWLEETAVGGDTHEYGSATPRLPATAATRQIFMPIFGR